MGKTRAECSQNAYIYKCFFKPLNTNFSKFFAQIRHKKKRRNRPCFFRILRLVGRGQHKKKKFGPHECPALKSGVLSREFREITLSCHYVTHLGFKNNRTYKQVHFPPPFFFWGGGGTTIYTQLELFISVICSRCTILVPVDTIH